MQIFVYARIRFGYICNDKLGKLANGMSYAMEAHTLNATFYYFFSIFRRCRRCRCRCRRRCRYHYARFVGVDAAIAVAVVFS